VDKELEAPLRAAIAALEQMGCRYAVVGGIALSQWGVLRYTHDVDLKVIVPEADYSGIRAQLLAAFPERARQHVPQNPLIVAVSIGEVIVDFLLALPGYDQQIVERAELRDLGGFTAWVCSAEDLIIQKVIAGREKDWPDVDSLLRARRSKLDYAYIEEWLGQFAEALETPELLNRYRQVRTVTDAAARR
jgi:hypothetical protein